MTRRLLATTIACSLVSLPSAPRGHRSAERRGAINWNLIMFPTNRIAPMDQQRKAPVKLFDNLYSVGVQTVCAFLIPTSAGLVLVDTTYPETADLLLDNIRKAGFDPASIRYIFSTHAATDHFGAAGRIKQVAPGARVGMPLADWEEAEQLMGPLAGRLAAPADFARAGAHGRPDAEGRRDDLQVLRVARPDPRFARHRVPGTRRVADAIALSTTARTGRRNRGGATPI